MIPAVVSSCPNTCERRWGLLPVDGRHLGVRGRTADRPGGRTARLERDEDGRLVARADTEVTDETMFALIDSARR